MDHLLGLNTCDKAKEGENLKKISLVLLAKTSENVGKLICVVCGFRRKYLYKEAFIRLQYEIAQYINSAIKTCHCFSRSFQEPVKSRFTTSAWRAATACAEAWNSAIREDAIL